MNILITAPSLNVTKNVSGISTVVNTIVNNTDKKHSFFHFLLGRSDQSNSFSWIFLLIKQLLLFPFFVKKNKIDLIHQNFPFDKKGVLREFVIHLFARIMHRPIILHLHGGAFIFNNTPSCFIDRLAKYMFQTSQHVIVLSQLEQKTLKKKYKLSNVTCLTNVVEFNPSNVLNKRRTQKTNLLYLGRIEKNKGVYELVEALNITYKGSFTFTLCGEGKDRVKIEESCKAIMGEDFRYAGIVGGNEKKKIIKNSDIFILPSYFEGLPMALLETMAMGVVPVVSDAEGMKTIIKDSYNGLVAKKYSGEDLALRLEKVLSNIDFWTELSQNAAKTIQTDYNIDNYMKTLFALYETSLF